MSLEYFNKKINRYDNLPWPSMGSDTNYQLTLPCHLTYLAAVLPVQWGWVWAWGLDSAFPCSLLLLALLPTSPTDTGK